MLRRAAVVAVCLAASALTAVVVSQPAAATTFASSNITAPIDGKHYMITNTHPVGSVPVTGTISPATPGAFVDVRCYDVTGTYTAAATNIPVDGTGTTFATTMQTNVPYGRCVLRAVPHGLSAISPVSSYTGPLITTEWNTTDKVTSGPNAGKTVDFYVEYSFAHAMNDFSSASRGGLWDSRLQYPDGSSSNYFWYGNAMFSKYYGAADHSPLRVDGHNAYLPYAARSLFAGSENNPGLRALSRTVSRDKAAGTATIHVIEPVVYCPHETYPATAGSCARFKPSGLRLERTIFITDGGLQVRIRDVWRSTNHKAHRVVAEYQQRVEGYDQSTGIYTETQVGIKLPWISNNYAAFTSEHAYPGPSSGPASIFIHDNNLASDGDPTAPRGAISFDVVPAKVHRFSNNMLTTRPAAFRVPADRTRLIRMFYVMGRNQSAVNAKAAANEARLG